MHNGIFLFVSPVLVGHVDGSLDANDLEKQKTCKETHVLLNLFHDPGVLDMLPSSRARKQDLA
jgi:hypothetical protein